MKRNLSFFINNNEGSTLLILLLVLSTVTILVYTTFIFSNSQLKSNKSFEKNIQLRYLIESAKNHALYNISKDIKESVNIEINENKNYEFDIDQDTKEINVIVNYKDFNRNKVFNY